MTMLAQKENDLLNPRLVGMYSGDVATVRADAVEAVALAAEDDLHTPCVRSTGRPRGHRPRPRRDRRRFTGKLPRAGGPYEPDLRGKRAGARPPTCHPMYRTARTSARRMRRIPAERHRIGRSAWRPSPDGSGAVHARSGDGRRDPGDRDMQPAAANSTTAPRHRWAWRAGLDQSCRDPRTTGKWRSAHDRNRTT
jgi:hypothetical protein